MQVKCLCLILCWVSVVRGQCVDKQTRGVEVSVRSARNTTGHWVTKVCLRQDDERASLEDTTLPWSVDIEPSTSSCGVAKSSFNIKLTFTAPPPRLPGYELFADIGYYKFHKEVVTWTKARAVCEEEGGHLMIINSEKEAEVVKHLFARYPVVAGSSDNGYGWTGIYRPVTTGGWVTVFGTPMNATGFNHWLPGLPVDAPGYNSMLANRHNGRYHDNPGERPYPFICEQDL